MSKMNKLEIFVAGSKELEEERSLVRTVASNMVAEYHRKGIVMHYAIYDYTNFDLSFDTDGQQTNYNKYISNQADLVIFILDKKIGDKTYGEFEVAYNAYSSKRRPKICVFSNKGDVEDANINKIRSKVSSLNQYYNEYKEKEQLAKMVDKLLRDSSDNIIAQSSRRKSANTLLGVVAIAVVAILGIMAYAFNLVSKTTDAVTSAPVDKAQVESSKVVVAEKPVVKTTQSQKTVATKSTTQPKATKPTIKKTAPVAVVETEESVQVQEVQISQPQPQPQPQPKPSLQSMADSGDLASCYALAVKLQSGNGVAQNPKLAFKYMKMAAEGGYSKAYRPLAEMYHKGAGVAKDRDIAAKWYQRAADSGDRKALYILNNL